MESIKRVYSPPPLLGPNLDKTQNVGNSDFEMIVISLLS